MAVNYLHGVETIEIDRGPRPVRAVKASVVGLIGTAPMGPVNTPIIVQNDRQAAQFGSKDLPGGFTIPQALDAIFDHGAGTVIVINVLDPETHVEAVAAESITFNAVTGRARLANGAISDLVLTDGDATTYALGDDYIILDAQTGELQRTADSAIPSGGTAEADYNHLDPSAVLAADIIGDVDVAGLRSGIQALGDTYNLFGFTAKILIAPVYSTQDSVRAELDVMANKLRGFSLVDAPIGTTPQQAIEGRGPAGAINFNTSSQRQILLYPHLKVYDAATDADRLEPYSQRFAGVWCKSIVERGYWFSPSNQEILGTTGAERPITAAINDPDTEANLLNEAGIVTLFNTFGSGLRTWGNRTAAWPSVTHPKNFIPVRMTADVIHESIELATLQFQDLPINNAFIDGVIQTASGFLRTLMQRGAILDGRVWYDPAENDPTQLAAGHIVFCYDFMPPTPAERVTYKSAIDIKYLANLGQTA